jgi:hypothetical protein
VSRKLPNSAGRLKAVAVLAALLVAFGGATAQRTKNEENVLLRKPLKELVTDFTSVDWFSKVMPAKLALETRESAALPELIALLDSDRRVELMNTADLIYPGAKMFYGHGRILDYDVDWLSVRAGWALEELTFKDFGFRGGTIKESDLLQAVLKGKRDVPLGEVTKPPGDVEAQVQRRAEAVRRAKDWWAGQGGSWRRFDELLRALRSDDSVRQVRALQWVRNGDTRCEGLSVQSYNQFILPEVKRLSGSADEGVRTEAGYLLEDKEGWWYKSKFKFEKPEGWSQVEVK